MSLTLRFVLKEVRHVWKQIVAAFSAVSFVSSFGGIITDDTNGWRCLINWPTRNLPDTCEFAWSC